MPEPDPHFDRKLAAIFRAEAGEHVQRMQQALAQLEGQDAPAAPALEQLFRASHSLKGAARAVGRDEVEMVCHATESLLAGVQRGRLPFGAALVDALHAVVAALGKALAEDGTQPIGELAALLPRLAGLENAGRGAADAPVREVHLPPEPEAGGAASDPAVATVRIPVQRLGQLLYQVEELVGLKQSAQEQVVRTRPALAGHGDLLGAMNTHARELAGAVERLLATMKQALLLPVGSLSPMLVAAVRELARSEGKEVEFRLQGDHVQLDRRLLQELREPLVHLLRNAIGHGLEPPPQRTQAGKPARGLLEVAIATRSAAQVEITVRDDGRGIDTARLAQAARDLQLDVPAEGGEAALLPLVFGSGVSTAGRVTAVAGRGVGLAIVRETVERLGGSVAVASEPGRGTTFTMMLPLSLSTFHAVEVRTAGRPFLLPLFRVERCLRFAPADVRRVGSTQAVAVGEEELPLVSLAKLLELQGSQRNPSAIHCLVLQADGRRIALAVDEIGAEQEVVSKPVDPGLTRLPVLGGAALVGAGRTVPILNVSELVRSALRAGESAWSPGNAAPAPQQAATLLLVEDSITSRTLLKNILELAGYQVEVAADGQQALEKLAAQRFDLVVSDVEMPRLDGIALTRAIRADPALARLPVVLVTSLGSQQDRERGAEAGASAYIVKSGFDQGRLLRTVRELL